jgi:hypothetical protein
MISILLDKWFQDYLRRWRKQDASQWSETAFAGMGDSTRAGGVVTKITH